MLELVLVERVSAIFDMPMTSVRWRMWYQSAIYLFSFGKITHTALHYSGELCELFERGLVMHCLGQTLCALFLLFLFLCASGQLEAQESANPDTLRQRAELYRKHIAKQQRNIQLMQQELQQHPDNPNPKILGNFFATASGVRTQAYRDEPPDIQTLIDKLEHDKALMALNATTLIRYPHNVEKAHFLIEIERSQKFIAMLRKQLKLTQAQIDSQAASHPVTTVKLADTAPIMGRWKYVKGVYEIEISGEDGHIKGLIKKSTPPEAGFPWDYKVGTTMFENGKLQPDGTCKVDWAQYTWKTSSLNKVLGRGTTPAVIKLRPDKEAFVAIGRNRVFESKAAHEKWLNEFENEFKFSFIKID